MATTPEQIQVPNVHSHSMTVHYHRPETATGSRGCDVCGHRISLGWYCHCAHCDFDTHMLCATIVEKFASSATSQRRFEHFHSQHPMTLLIPGTAERYCNVCGLCISSGSYYKCQTCDFDAHLVCAFISNVFCIDPRSSTRATTALPTKLFERIHNLHQMTLLDTAKGKRVCDVCGHQISLGQYYQCAPCGFDAHILCAIIGNFDPSTGTRSPLPMGSSDPPAYTGTRPQQPMISSAPAAYTVTGPQQPMISSAPAPNTGISSGRPSGTQIFMMSMSAVSAIAAAARLADWVTVQATGEGIFDHFSNELNAHGSVSTGTWFPDNSTGTGFPDHSDPAGTWFPDNSGPADTSFPEEFYSFDF